MSLASFAPTPQKLYEVAQDIIRTGQPVFPCRPSGDKAKAPFTRHGLHDATTNRDTIKRWIKQHGVVALGIPTGHKYDVLDVDVKKGADGRVHMRRLQDLGLLNGCKRVAQTPSGGWHLYFKAARGITNSASATLGLDVRGLGGYVIAPPSYIETNEYEGAYVDAGETTDSTDDPLLWDLIVSALIPINESTRQPIKDLLPSERRSSVAALREWISMRVSGERNNALHWAVCRCIESGIDPHELVEAALLSGLTEDETLLTIRSAIRRAGLDDSELKSEAEVLFPDPV